MVREKQDRSRLDGGMICWREVLRGGVGGKRPFR